MLLIVLHVFFSQKDWHVALGCARVLVSLEMLAPPWPGWPFSWRSATVVCLSQQACDEWCPETRCDKMWQDVTRCNKWVQLRYFAYSACSCHVTLRWVIKSLPFVLNQFQGLFGLSMLVVNKGSGPSWYVWMQYVQAARRLGSWELLPTKVLFLWCLFGGGYCRALAPRERPHAVQVASAAKKSKRAGQFRAKISFRVFPSILVSCMLDTHWNAKHCQPCTYMCRMFCNSYSSYSDYTVISHYFNGI